MHGSLRQFGAASLFGPLRHNRLLGISASRNRDVGIQFFGSSRSLVRNSSGNRTTSALTRGRDRRVRLASRPDPEQLVPAQRQVGITPVGSTSDLIKGNLVRVTATRDSSWRAARAFRSGATGWFETAPASPSGPGSHNVITRNHVSGGRDGIRIEKGHGNLVAHNVVIHARRAGIRLGIRIRSSAAVPTTSSAEIWSGTAAWMGSWSIQRTATAS